MYNLSAEQEKIIILAINKYYLLPDNYAHLIAKYLYDNQKIIFRHIISHKSLDYNVLIYFLPNDKLILTDCKYILYILYQCMDFQLISSVKTIVKEMHMIIYHAILNYKEHEDESI